MPDSFADKLAFAAILMVVVIGIAVVQAVIRLARTAAARRASLTDETAVPESLDQQSGRTSGFGRRRAAGNLVGEAEPVDQAAAPAPAANPLAGMDAATLLARIIADNAPPPPHEGPLPRAIEAARRRPIVFRVSAPEGPDTGGLSFYGGQPIGPADFIWPRSQGADGVPLTFIMQWDCAQLAPLDATGLMPDDGVLYCFIDLSWGNGSAQAQLEAFLHHSGPTEGWAEIPVPDDAPPIFGDQGPRCVAGCTDKVDDAAAFVPRIMPRFPFAPAAFDYPLTALDPAEGERLFWGDASAAPRLLAVQNEGRADTRPVRDIDAPRPDFARPFAAFPHDFGAVRVLAAAMLDQTRRPDRPTSKHLFSDLSDEERVARINGWHNEAKELFALGCQRPAGTAIEQQIADDVWRWAEERQGMLRFGFDNLVVRSVNLSLGVGSAAIGRIPAEWIDKAMAVHALASEYMADEAPDHSRPGGYDEWRARKEAGELPRVRNTHAPTPAHMFGPPSYVQGYVEELVDDHLLLLELTSGSGPEHHFGEGVLQYLISPEDLAARRFDRVTSVLSGY